MTDKNEGGLNPLMVDSDETGRTWPHGERRATPRVNLGKNMHTRSAPPMTGEMREWMTGVLDDEYNKGVAKGRKDGHTDNLIGEVVMFCMGAAAALGIEWTIRWIAH
jgi:hypothetical protein